MAFSSDSLYTRHRLSHQQINDWLNQPNADFPIEDKLKNMAKMAEFIAITDKLKENDIEFISLKGPLLSHRLYRDTTYRRYRDFDFLLNPEHAQRAYHLLMDLGYQPYNLVLPKTESKVKEYFKHIHDTPLYNSSNGLIIEIHTKLLRYRHLPKAKLNSIINSNLIAIELSGRKFTVLNNELELLYLIIHGGLHRYKRLKWLVDIKDFLDRIPFDEQKFEQLVNQFKAQKLVGLYNEISRTFELDSKLLKNHSKPSKALLSNTIQTINDDAEAEAGTFKKFMRFIYFTLSIQPGWRYKLSVIFKHLYLSYSVNSKNDHKSPLIVNLIKVPFQAAARWISPNRKTTSEF